MKDKYGKNIKEGSKIVYMTRHGDYYSTVLGTVVSFERIKDSSLWNRTERYSTFKYIDNETKDVHTVRTRYASERTIVVG